MHRFTVLSAISSVLKRVGFLGAAICIFNVTCSAQKIEVPKGTKVEFAVVGKEAKEPMPEQMSVADFQVRLKQGGTFSLSGGILFWHLLISGKTQPFLSQSTLWN